MMNEAPGDWSGLSTFPKRKHFEHATEDAFLKCHKYLDAEEKCEWDVILTKTDRVWLSTSFIGNTFTFLTRANLWANR